MLLGKESLELFVGTISEIPHCQDAIAEVVLVWNLVKHVFGIKRYAGPILILLVCPAQTLARPLPKPLYGSKDIDAAVAAVATQGVLS